MAGLTPMERDVVSSVSNPSPVPCRRTRRHAARWPAALALTLLLGCGTIPLPGQLREGMTEPEVSAAMGQPTGRYAIPNGATRLEFATGPLGRETWMVDLDASGRMTKAEQVLDGWHFLKVSEGMDRDAVSRILGRPGEVRRDHQKRDNWFWRYNNNDCLIAVATFDTDGRVIGGVAQMPDPRCEMRAR